MKKPGAYERRLGTPFWFALIVFGLLIVASSLNSIVIAQSESFIFTASGDHGGPNEADTRSSLEAIANSGAVFHLALGDLSYSDSGPEPTDGVTPSPWCSGTDPNRNIRLTIGETFPFQLIVGNHEDDDFVDGFINNFAVCLPDRMNSTGVYGAEYYFDYPQPNPYLRVIMIGAGNDVNGERYDYELGNAHYAWLEAAIDSARQGNIPWIVVGVHKNCLTMGNKDCAIGEALMDLLIAKRVDLVLQGHDHDYQRSKQLTCAYAGVFDASCVADDGVDGLYAHGGGTVFLINGNFGGGGFTSIDCNDSERDYFARAMGGNGSVWRDGGCNTQRVGRGITVYTVTPDRIDARFHMTYEVTGSGELFSDAFSIVRGNDPTPIVTSTVTPVVDTPTPTGDTVLTLNAVADAYVHETTPGENFGSSDALRTDASPVIRSYLRFQAPPLSGSIVRATLRLFAETSSGIGYDIYATGGGWDEATINFTNAPALGSSIGSSGGFSANTWTVVDVTALVTGEGQHNLAMASADTTQVRFSSREGTNPPQLIVEVVPNVPPSSTPLPTPVVAPQQPTGLTVVGDLTTAPVNPTYRWNHDNIATLYMLTVNNASGNIIQATYTTEQLGCSVGVCSVQTGVVLSNGTHTWSVIGQNAGINGPMSAVATFTVNVVGNMSDGIGIYARATGAWYLRNSAAPGAPDYQLTYGGSWAAPVVGDWNGDGVDSLGVYDSANGNWYLRNSNANGSADIVVNGYGGWWGLPLSGDWDGNGSDTIGLFVPNTGEWLLRNSNSYGSPDVYFTYGGSWGYPVVGDWNGDGRDTIGIYNPTNGDWYLRNSNSGGGADAVVNGYGGWWGFPIVGDWDGNGSDTIGLFAYQTGEWLLRNSNSYGSPDISFSYGGDWGTPLSGDWNGPGSLAAELMAFSDDWNSINQTLSALGTDYSLEDLLRFSLDPSSPVGATATEVPATATSTEVATEPLMATATTSVTPTATPTETSQPKPTPLPPFATTAPVPSTDIPVAPTNTSEPSTTTLESPTDTPAPALSPIPTTTSVPST